LCEWHIQLNIAINEFLTFQQIRIAIESCGQQYSLKCFYLLVLSLSILVESQVQALSRRQIHPKICFSQIENYQSSVQLKLLDGAQMVVDGVPGIVEVRHGHVVLFPKKIKQSSLKFENI
jgi:hypothetical protein